MRSLGRDDLAKTAIDPELLNMLLHAGAGTAAGHIGGNLTRMAAGKFAPNFFPRMAQTGVQHGFDRRRISPSLEKFMGTAIMPESVAEYQMGRQAGRVGRVTQRALQTEDPALRTQRLGRMQKLMNKDTPTNNPLASEMSNAIKLQLSGMAPGQAKTEMDRRMQTTPLGRAGKTIAEDVGSRLSPLAPAPATKAIKIPRFMTSHEKAKPSLLGRAAGLGAMGAGVVAEPGYAGHIGINKFRHWLGGTKPGQKAMSAAVQKGFKGEKTGPLVRSIRDVGMTPFLSELEDVGHAMNIAQPMKPNLMSRLAPPGSRRDVAKQKIQNFGKGMAGAGVRAAQAVKGVAGKARQIVPRFRPPKV